MENVLEKEISDKDIALASFSGYLAFSGNMAEIDEPKIDEIDENKNPYGLVETAEYSVSLYNQQINQSYDDIMSFLLG